MNLLDILYPRRCALCDRVVAGRNYPVCFACRKWIQPIRGPRCLRCSKPLENEREEYCLDCSRMHFTYDRGFAACVYTGKIQESLMRFKYQGRQEYAVFYAGMLDALAGQVIAGWKPEVLIPVPVHPARLRRRGYNQAEVLAGQLQRRWNIPVDSKCVRRVKRTRAQKNLDDKERRKNLRQAFGLVGPVPYHSVLIVDDIYTTGSTVDAISRILKENGVQKVYFVTVCIGRGF